VAGASMSSTLTEVSQSRGCHRIFLVSRLNGNQDALEDTRHKYKAQNQAIKSIQLANESALNDLKSFLILFVIDL
jgi:hypothetical protein